jgi:hypothetical protein
VVLQQQPLGALHGHQAFGRCRAAGWLMGQTQATVASVCNCFTLPVLKPICNYL